MSSTPKRLLVALLAIHDNGGAALESELTEFFDDEEEWVSIRRNLLAYHLVTIEDGELFLTRHGDVMAVSTKQKIQAHFQKTHNA